MAEPGSRILVLPDCHYPNHDADSIDLVLRAAKDIGVTSAIHLGDLLDFYSVSRWEKDPNISAEVGEVADEVRSAIPLFNYLNSLKNGWIWLEGNHEVRFKSYVSKSPTLRSLGYTVKKLLNEVDPTILSNCVYLESDYRLVLNPSTVIEHGHGMARALRPKAEYCLLDDYPEQTSIIGHTHKIFDAHKTVHGRSGVPIIRSVYSVGHLSDETKQNFAKDPKWQEGFMVITVYLDTMRGYRYDYHQVVIVKDEQGRPSFTLWGKVYK